MKIIVLSDSHGNLQPLLQAVATTGPDMILHLGDHEKDCSVLRQNFPQIPLRAVKGNNDFSSKELISDEFVVEGKRIFMTHGHMYGVKTGLASLINTAHCRKADILLFGHTHVPYCKWEEGMYVINPGSVGMGSKTYAVLDIEHGAVVCMKKSSELF